MSTYKRGDVAWYSFIWRGRRIQRSTKQPNLRVAGQIEDAHRTALAKGEAGIFERKPAPSFTELQKEFLESVKAERNPRTHRRYEVSLVALKKAFGDKLADEITQEGIEKYRSSRLADKKSFATVNRDLACLRRMLRRAVQMKKLTHTPFSDGAIRQLQEKERGRAISFAEEREYLAAASPLLRDVATLILECGLRPSEVFNLQQADVNLTARTAFIRQGKTGNSRRMMPLTNAAQDVLKNRVANAKGPYLFPFRLGRAGKAEAYDWNKPMTQIWNAHSQALTDSKLKSTFRLYDLRHTFGTRACEAGLDPLTLKKLMGHSSLSVTNRYTHLSQQHLADATKRMEAYRATREVEETPLQTASIQ